MINPTPSKPFSAIKLIWYVAGVAAIAMGIVAVLGWITLNTADDIQYLIIRFYKLNKILFYTNLASFLVLLIIAAYIHRVQGRRRYYLLPCGIFLFFAYIGYGVLNGKLLEAYQTFEMQEGILAFNTYFGMLLSVSALLMAGVVFVGVSMQRKRT